VKDWAVRSQVLLAAILMSILMSIAGVASPQEPAAPAGVQLRLATLGGQTQFRIGQPIRVTLTFEAASAPNYSVSTAVPLRHLRPQTPDQFTAEPAAGWVDPLKDLQWTMDAGGNPMRGNESKLDPAHPVTVERSLNEFVVFRKPGRYIVHCTSGRLTNNGSTGLESSGLALDILPRDDAEDVRQFASARATLETGKPPKEPERIMRMDKENAQSSAVSTLRDLDTEPAAVYLASIFGQGRHTEGEIEYALYASEHREPIVRELELRLADPDLTATQSYLITLTMLKARLEEIKIGHAFSTADWNALDETVNQRVFDLAARKTPHSTSLAFRNKSGSLYALGLLHRAAARC